MFRLPNSFSFFSDLLLITWTMLEAIALSDECPLLSQQDRCHPQPLLFQGKRNSLYGAIYNKYYYGFTFLSEPCMVFG